MAHIVVDKAQLEATAKAVDSCRQTLKKDMGNATKEVQNLSAAWSGEDYTAFLKQWDEIKDKESVYYQLDKALDSYAKYLRYAKKQYEDAQEKAVKAANLLR